MAGIKIWALRNWSAVCPKCGHVEASPELGTKCDNCGAPAYGAYGRIGPHDHWESDQARQSWRQIACSKGCGWSVTSLECSKCGATIKGDYIKGDKAAGDICFVATAAFGDEGHPTVERLRQFRDTRLIKTPAGRTFVRIYYAQGPKLASIVNRLPSIKPTIRRILTALADRLPPGR